MMVETNVMSVRDLPHLISLFSASSSYRVLLLISFLPTAVWWCLSFTPPALPRNFSLRWLRASLARRNLKVSGSTAISWVIRFLQVIGSYLWCFEKIFQLKPDCISVFLKAFPQTAVGVSVLLCLNIFVVTTMKESCPCSGENSMWGKRRQRHFQVGLWNREMFH